MYGIIVFLRWLPKITLFYYLLTKIGLAHYSIFLLLITIALDITDYV